MSDYAQFAADFRRRAVTEARVVSAMAALAERQLRFGPYAAGPLASIEATGRLSAASVSMLDDSPSFAVTVPATLDLVVRLGARSRLRADVEIDLRLTPRLAADGFLFIDAGAVRAADVRIALRGRGLGLAVSGIAGGLPAVVTDEVRRQVARQVTALLRGSRSRRSRTIDIGARIDGSKSRRPPATLTWVDDDTFGREFVARAVSTRRVEAGFAELAGQPVSIGPVRVGGVATVRATGGIGEAGVSAVAPTPDPTFDIALGLHLDLVVTLGRPHRYRCEVVARLRAVARPADGVRIVVDIAPLTADDVTATVHAADRLARGLGRAGRIESQLIAQIVRVVNEKVAAADRTVDVGAIIGSDTDDGATEAPRPRPGP